MGHNCEGECKHEDVKYCQECQLAYCEDCGKEWKEYYTWTDCPTVMPYYPYSYDTYPQWTYTTTTGDFLPYVKG